MLAQLCSRLSTRKRGSGIVTISDMAIEEIRYISPRMLVQTPDGRHFLLPGYHTTQNRFSPDSIPILRTADGFLVCPSSHQKPVKLVPTKVDDC